MKARVVFILVIVATILASDSVPALGVFVGSSSWTFGTPVADVNAVYGGVGTDMFNSGTPASTLGSPDIVLIGGLNFSIPADTPFPVGRLAYTNGETVPGTNVDSVPIDIQVTFIEPLGIPNPVFRFWFDFEITDNDTGNPWDDADFFKVSNHFSGTFFSVGADLYTLELLGFSIDGGSTIVSSLALPEREDPPTQADFYAQFVIPEPTGLALFGMVGFSLLRRRRKLRCCGGSS